MKNNLKIPAYAIDPLYGIVLFNWFVFMIKGIMKDKHINMYVIHNNSYKEVRKSSGPFLAKMSKKKVANIIMEIEEVVIIGDYDVTKLLVLTQSDITKELQDAFSKKDIEVTIGVAASTNDDNEFTILDRATRALNIAQSKNITFQRL